MCRASHSFLVNKLLSIFSNLGCSLAWSHLATRVKTYSMPVHGSVECFDRATDDWSTYVERLEHYLIANDIITKTKRPSTLLTLAGPEVYSLACNLVAPDKSGDKSYDDLVALIMKHYSPTPSIIVQLYKFHTTVRNQGESIANFVADLRNIAKHCEFNGALDDMLRDRLVCSVNEPKIQK